MIDYLGEDGCCLICVERGECDHPCFECKCRKCKWYSSPDGYCLYPKIKKYSRWFIDFKIRQVTKNAMLLQLDPYTEAWFPKSQIGFDDDGCVGIPYWLLEEKGWMGKGDWEELGGMSFKEFEGKRLSRTFSPDRFAPYYPG